MVILEWLYEYWAPVTDNSNYEISNWGRYRNAKTKKILSQQLDKYGYAISRLCYNGKRASKKTHQLVMNAFNPNHKNLPCINHKDEDKTNNCVWNLEWCTVKYNNNYGTKNQRHSEKIEKPVLQYTLDGQFVDRYNSAQEAADALGISYKEGIQRCARGIYEHSCGFIWKYA